MRNFVGQVNKNVPEGIKLRKLKCTFMYNNVFISQIQQSWAIIKYNNKIFSYLDRL